jgi:hypothetical protein
MIIETSCNRFYQVREHDIQPEMAHCYLGIELRKTKNGFSRRYGPTHRRYGQEELVRKAATRVVEA